MEFTKEQIKVAIKVIDDYDAGMNPKSDMVSLSALKNRLELKLKPETKKIVVEIELDENVGTVENLLNALEVLNVVSVKHLPEVFSREDIYEIFGINTSFTSKSYVNLLLDNWLSEGSKK